MPSYVFIWSVGRGRGLREVTTPQPSKPSADNSSDASLRLRPLPPPLGAFAVAVRQRGGALLAPNLLLVTSVMGAAVENRQEEEAFRTSGVPAPLQL